MISTFEEDRKFPTSVTPDSFIKETNDATDLNSAPHGQFQEKNYDYWIEFFLFKIFFRRKILMIDTAYYVRGHKCTQKMQTLSTKKSKVCKKLTSVCVLRVGSGKKFTDELNVLSWNITTKNKKSTQLNRIWWKMMRVKSWRTDVSQTTSFWRSIYIFQSNALLQVYVFHFQSRKKESKL